MLTTAQLAARKSGIGGSEVAAILGLSPWRTGLDVYLDKIGEGTPQKETKRQRRGSAIEPLILAEFERRMGIKLDRMPYTAEPLRSPRHPWMLANLDGRMDPRTLVEAKASWSSEGWGEDGSPEVPPYYQTQACHYFEVTDADVCFFPVLFGMDGLDWQPLANVGQDLVWTPMIAEDADFRIYTVERDNAFIKDVIEVEREFWHGNVLARVPPAPVNREDAMKIWGRDRGHAIEVDAEIAKKVEYLKELRQEQKALKERDEALVDELAIAFQDASVLLHNGAELATYKAQTRKSYVVKESSFRVMRLK